MRTSTCAAALLAVLFAAAACQQTKVRGPHGEELTATAPRWVTIHRGESVPLTVGIDRDRFSGPVTVSISQLPTGVAVDRRSQRVDTDAATFALRANRDADLVAKQAVRVTVRGPDGRETTQYVDLTVAE
jgi:hypothetical protein